VSAWLSAPSEAMTSGFKAVQERAIQFAKENAETGFALAHDLTKAKEWQAHGRGYAQEPSSPSSARYLETLRALSRAISSRMVCEISFIVPMTRPPSVPIVKQTLSRKEMPVA
jgi:hypothetical protein